MSPVQSAEVSADIYEIEASEDSPKETPTVLAKEDAGEIPDEYVPAPAAAAYWHFFRNRRSADRAGKNVVFCLVHPCEQPPVGQGGESGTRRLWQRLERHHNVDMEAAMAQTDAGEVPHAGEGTDAEGRATGKLFATTNLAPELAKANLTVARCQKNIQTRMHPKANMNVNAAFVREVTIQDVRAMRICETFGSNTFVQAMVFESEAKLTWEPPAHSTMKRIMDFVCVTMRNSMRELLREIPTAALILHSAVWSDNWNRVWVGSYMVFLHSQTWAPMNLLVGFEHVGVVK